MIICSCVHVTTSDIERAIEWMRASDPQAIVTPGKVYRALGKRPECGGCISLFVETMRTELKPDTPSDLPRELRGLRTGRKKRNDHAG